MNLSPTPRPPKKDGQLQGLHRFSLDPGKDSVKVFHTTAAEFKSLVQRLTGRSPPGDLPPAAKLASIEVGSSLSNQMELSATDTIAIDDDFMELEGLHMKDPLIPEQPIFDIMPQQQVAEKGILVGISELLNF
ncbi:hypothetical protein M0R45_027256 [Rubus argutus]|uniref:VQ domain-containing protein n=1 Tax=Rubus argutus TaxID=59490 RepID=A0AAW1X2H5_RUBAR